MSYGDFLLMAMESIANSGELSTADGIRKYARTSLDNAHDLKLKEMLLAPTQPEWTGEGLPPAGTVCELRKITGGWGTATIKYMSDTQCVWLWENGNPDQIEWACVPCNMEFRPIRTPEQIAADEREQDINEMVALSPMLDKGWARKVCTAIYDAGYRKQEAP